MAFARVIIDGVDLEFSGDVEVSLLGYSNSTSASRSGRNYVESQTKPKMITIGDVMADPADLITFKELFGDCATRRFVITVVFGENCDSPESGRSRFIFTGCTIDGDGPTANLNTKKVSDFAFAYEVCTAKDS